MEHVYLEVAYLSTTIEKEKARIGSTPEKEHRAGRGGAIRRDAELGRHRFRRTKGMLLAKLEERKRPMVLTS
jgi:hypothetical protein